MTDMTAPIHMTKPDGSIWTLREISALVGTTSRVEWPNGSVTEKRITVARPCPKNFRNAHIGYGDPA